jgi:L-alanine-DL-glutamate epimerase-like enolase superfamily enzyme
MRNGKNYFVRARSKDGAVGYADAHSSVMSAAYPILIKKVAPVLAGKDARDLESLLDEVYLANSNYKWQGLPFWVSVACAEIAILDLLGKTVKKPLGALFGNLIRTEIPVYRASGNRGNSPEAENRLSQEDRLRDRLKGHQVPARRPHALRRCSNRRDQALIRSPARTFGDAWPSTPMATAPSTCPWPSRPAG